MLQNGETALHLAAKGGCVEVIKMLVKYGAAADIRSMVLNFVQQTVYTNSGI